MGEIVLHYGSGASDFERIGPAWDAAGMRPLMFNVRRLLTVRGQQEAVALLDAIPFSIYPATNHFNDDFHILHADLPLAEYESLRLTQKEKQRAAGNIAEAVSEANGPYIRFVAVGFALANPESWDVFLCHASEDKEAIARPIYEHLEASGIHCWLDQAQIAWGESLVSKIQDGLTHARFVLVVLSTTFLRKPWAAKELSSALTMEIESGRNLVLPLLCGDPKSLLSTLPFLIDKRYLIWQGDVALVESELRALVRNRDRCNPLPVVPDDPSLRAEFEKLRRRILYVEITNELPGALRDLRTLFIDHGLVDRPHLRPFFDAWLSSPIISVGAPVPNLLTGEQIRQMSEELRRLNF